MKKITFVMLSFFLLTTTYGQDNLSKSDAEKYATMFNDAGGTYQFQIIDSREKLTIPFSFILQIEEARDEKEVIYIPFKENVRVKILPKSLIISGNYEALEKFAFINSTDL